MCPWLFNVYIDAVMKEIKNWFEEEGSEIHGRENGDCLASCMQMTWFCGVRRT